MTERYVLYESALLFSEHGNLEWENSKQYKSNLVYSCFRFPHSQNKKKWKIKIISIIILYPILWIRIMYKYHYLIELETKTENNGVFLSSSSKSLEFFIRTEVWCVRLSFLDVLHEALLLALGLCGLMNYFVSKSYVICKVRTLDTIYWQIVILFRLTYIL